MWRRQYVLEMYKLIFLFSIGCNSPIPPCGHTLIAGQSNALKLSNAIDNPHATIAKAGSGFDLEWLSNSSLRNRLSEAYINASIVFWLQGERDSSTLELANNYSDNFSELVSELRYQNNGIPFVAVLPNINLNKPYVNIVRNAFIDWQSAMPNTFLIEVDDLPLKEDGIHYDDDELLIIWDRLNEIER